MLLVYTKTSTRNINMPLTLELDATSLTYYHTIPEYHKVLAKKATSRMQAIMHATPQLDGVSIHTLEHLLAIALHIPVSYHRC